MVVLLSGCVHNARDEGPQCTTEGMYLFGSSDCAGLRRAWVSCEKHLAPLTLVRPLEVFVEPGLGLAYPNTAARVERPDRVFVAMPFRGFCHECVHLSTPHTEPPHAGPGWDRYLVAIDAAEYESEGATP